MGNDAEREGAGVKRIPAASPGESRISLRRNCDAPCPVAAMPISCLPPP